jgi:hypothetical protein
VIDARRLRRVRELHALPNLSLIPGLEELLDREHPMHVLEHALDRCAVLEVPTHDLGPKASQLSPRGLLRIPGERTYPETSLEKAPRHSSSLLARSPTYQDQTPPVAPAFHASSFTLVVLEPSVPSKRTLVRFKVRG